MYTDMIHSVYNEYPQTLHVYLDTVSVENPLINHIKFNGHEESTVDWLHYKRNLINSDIYVSPDGDNSNSGLTVDEPLKNLHLANSLINPTADNPLTIHIRSGLYSKSENGDLFPIGLKSYLNILGEDRFTTIFDAEFLTGFIDSEGETTGSSIKNLTFTQGLVPNHSGPVVSIGGPTDIELENLQFLRNKGYDGTTDLFIGTCHAEPDDNYKVVMRDILFDGSCGTYVMQSLRCHIDAENIVIRNSVRNLESNPPYLFHLGSKFEGFFDDNTEVRVIFKNSLFHSNEGYASHGSTTFAQVSNGVHFSVVNCTFADNNSFPDGSCIGIFDEGSEFEIINCLFENNTPKNFSVLMPTNGVESSLYLTHTLFDEDGNNYIYEDVIDLINYESLVYGDPLFIEDNPYHISENSPAVNMGTLDLPDDILMPEYDLAGNPRVIGGAIDAGCYENQTVDNDELGVSSEYWVSSYPNPFTTDGRDGVSKISFNLPADSQVSVRVYNIRGQLVNELLNEERRAGVNEVTWNGNDKYGTKTSSGIYFYRVSTSQKVVTGKMLLIK